MNRIQRHKVSALVGLRKRAPIGIGHNMGPPLSNAYHLKYWRKAVAKAWEPPPDRLILQRRLKRAKELGMTYREYMLEILERGKHL